MADSDDRRIAARVREPRMLSADRIEELRARINAGMYTSDPILRATARAIVEREDL